MDTKQKEDSTDRSCVSAGVFIELGDKEEIEMSYLLEIGTRSVKSKKKEAK